MTDQDTTLQSKSKEIAQPQKKRTALQILLGIIAGALTLFVLIVPLLTLFARILGPERSQNSGAAMPALIVAGLLVIIISLLTRKKFLAFTITFFLASVAFLGFVFYVLYFFPFGA